MRNHDFNAFLKKHPIFGWKMGVGPLGGSFGSTVISQHCFQKFRDGTPLLLNKYLYRVHVDHIDVCFVESDRRTLMQDTLIFYQHSRFYDR